MFTSQGSDAELTRRVCKKTLMEGSFNWHRHPFPMHSVKTGSCFDAGRHQGVYYVPKIPQGT